MTIILTKPVRVGGVELAAATTQSLSADVEADLVSRASAAYTINPTIGQGGVPVMADINNLTGGIKLSIEKTLFGGWPSATEPLGLIGDSRTENGGYFSPNVSAASISGSIISVTAPFIGTQAAVGSTVIWSHNPAVTVLTTSYDFIVAKVLSVVDADNITAQITYPATLNCLPSGALNLLNSKCMIDCNYPNYSSSIQAWLLGFRNKAYSQVYNAGFNGARIQDGITHQVPYLISKGCKEFWLYLGINDIIENVDNRPATYLIEKYKEIYLMLRGNKVVHFLEQPLSGAYATPTNKQRVLDVNSWINANAASYGVSIFDAYTPILDQSTGYAATGMLSDGIHHTQKGSFVTAMSAQGNLNFLSPGNYKASKSDLGSALQPVPNPTFNGTYGLSQLATGYSGIVNGVVIDSYALNLLGDGVTGEQELHLTSTAAAQSYGLRSASFTVIPGQKYRISMTVEVIDGVSVDYIAMTLNQQSNSAKYGDVFYQANPGYADGSYILTASADYVCHATLTSAHLKATIGFAGVGGATVKTRNWECRAIP